MIHRHRPLGDRRERKFLDVGRLHFERRVVERQRIEVGLDALGEPLGRTAARPLSLRCEPEALQHFRIQMHEDRVAPTPQTVALRPLHVTPVPVAHVAVGRRHLVLEDAIICGVHLPLFRVRLAAHRLLPVCAAPAGEKADPGARLGLVADDEIRVIDVLARAAGVDERGQLQAARKLDQDLLERLAFPGGRQHRHAHRVHGAVELGDRPVEHRHDVVALEVGGVRQNQVGERGHLGMECVAHHQKRNLVFAPSFPLGFPPAHAVVEHLAHLDRVHGRVPCHVGHEDHQRVEGIRVSAPRVGDHVVHESVNRQWVFPGKRLVDTYRAAFVIDEQVLRRARPAHREPRKRRIWPHPVRTRGRLRRRRNGARKRRLVAKPARSIDRAQQTHQDRERTHRMKAVRMGSEPAHGVKRHWIAGHGLMLVAPAVGPGDRQFDLLVARGDAHFVRESPDGGRRYARDALGPLWRVSAQPVGEQLKSRLHAGAVGQREIAEQVRVRVGRVRDHRAIRMPVPPELILCVQRIDRVGVFVHGEQSESRGLRIDDHQLTAIGVARDEVAVVQALGNEFASERHQESAVGTGPDRHPLVGDRRIAGAHRVDRDEASAGPLEFRDRDLERVGVVVLRSAKHDEEFRALEVRTAELPERAADGVDHARGHVHRAKAAVRCVIGRAELAREQAGERLHLVAPGKQRELLRVGGANLRQAFFQDPERLVPGDRLELAGAALGTCTPLERLGQPGRRRLLHDAAGPLGADHPLVERMFRVAVDIAYRAIAQVHPDAAAAGTHVASGGFDFVAQLEIRIG